MKRIFAGAVFLILLAGLAPAQTIQLKSGNRIQGKIVEETDDYIRLDAGVDTPLTFYRDEIDQIIEGDQHFLWKVTSGQATVYLFGSIHLGKPEMYPLPQVIEEAFGQSSALVLEIDLEKISPEVAQMTMMQKGTYLNGEQLKDQISSQTFQRLTDRLNQFGLPLEHVANFKPWLMAMTLSVLQIKALGFDEKYGVDHYFSGKAVRAGKPILELESLEEQINFMDSIEDQNKFLDYTLISMDETEKMLTEILDSWQRGDAANMEKIAIVDLLAQYPDTRPILDILLFNRNPNMAYQIKDFLKSGKTYFVVIGAAHLIGTEGIVELLKDEGFKVEQL